MNEMTWHMYRCVDCISHVSVSSVSLKGGSWEAKGQKGTGMNGGGGRCVCVLSFVPFLLCDFVLSFVFLFWALCFCFDFCDSVLSFMFLFSVLWFCLGFVILFWVLWFCFVFCNSVLGFCDSVFGFAILFYCFVILFWVLLFCFKFSDSVLGFLILFWVLWFCFGFCDSVLGFCACVKLRGWQSAKFANAPPLGLTGQANAPQ